MMNPQTEPYPHPQHIGPVGLPPLAGGAPFPPVDDASARAPSTWKAVYTIVDRGRGRKTWLRIGVAFVNRDLSLNVRLDAVPTNGTLHIRDAPPRESPGGSGEPLPPLDERDGPGAPGGPSWRE